MQLRLHSQMWVDLSHMLVRSRTSVIVGPPVVCILNSVMSTTVPQRHQGSNARMQCNLCASCAQHTWIPSFGSCLTAACMFATESPYTCRHRCIRGAVWVLARSHQDSMAGYTHHIRPKRDGNCRRPCRRLLTCHFLAAVSQRFNVPQ